MSNKIFVGLPAVSISVSSVAERLKRKRIRKQLPVSKPYSGTIDIDRNIAVNAVTEPESADIMHSHGLMAL